MYYLQMIPMHRFILFLVLLNPFYLAAQMEDYAVHRPVIVHSSGWHAIALTPDVRSEMKSGDSDIRLYEVRPNDTLEVPYVVRSHAERYRQIAVAMTMINQGITPDGFQCVLSLGKSRRINRIRLEFDEPNFDWLCRLEGSPDMNQWVMISSGYRLVGLHNEVVDYRHTSLHFDEADFAFYRLTLLDVRQKPRAFTASVFDDRRDLAVFDTLNAVWDVELMPKERRSQIIVQLSDSLPVSRIDLSLFHPSDYYRNVRMYFLRNTIRTEKGLLDNWVDLGRYVLSSLDSAHLSIPPTTTRKIKLEIDNRDDQPLTINHVRALALRTELVADLSHEKHYVLAYGKANARSPEYDLVFFADKIPDIVSDAELGEASSRDTPENEPAGLLKNPLWVWLSLSLIILLIGGFSLSLLRKSKT